MRHRGRLVILDGYHRLLKTLLLGMESIKAVVVRRDELERETGSNRGFDQ